MKSTQSGVLKHLDQITIGGVPQHPKRFISQTKIRLIFSAQKADQCEAMETTYCDLLENIAHEC